MAKTPKTVISEAPEAISITRYRMFCPVAEGSNELVLVGEADTVEELVTPEGPYQIEAVSMDSMGSSICVTLA